MKVLFAALCLLIVSGCMITKQRKLERKALDSVRSINEEGAVTDSIYVITSIHHKN